MYVLFPEVQRKLAEETTHHVAGFAGNDGTLQGQSVSLMVTSCKDSDVARKLPEWFEERFKVSPPLLRRQGVMIDRVELIPPKGIRADVTSFISATGWDKEGNKRWKNVQLRALKDKRLVELVLRNVEMPESEMVSLINEAIETISLLPDDAPARSPRTAEHDAEDD